MNTIAIMQPYFFPYIGYFQLMHKSDVWIIFDNVQFIDKGWINRNRILHPAIEKEWQYITVPLSKRTQFSKICDIKIKNSENWKNNIFGKLSFYKKKAPHYNETINFLRECFSVEHDNLSFFLTHSLKMTAQLLDIDSEIQVQSHLGIPKKDAIHPGQWALNISKELNAKEYVNPLGGAEIFQPDEFTKSKIKLSFLEPDIDNYKQANRSFVPGLSIIDVMMWNDIDEIKEFVKKGNLIKAN
ncbi:WbqC family protein [Vreelandella titanicae]|uniref:WbqC family protein n=1 Tax=Vreelandella titanicae TaxID=664683 RepID=UPI0039BEE9C4